MHLVVSQFVSRTAAEIAVTRLLLAGFARRDISVSRGGAPRWHEINDEDSPTTNRSVLVLSIVGGILSALLGAYLTPIAARWLSSGHHVHVTAIAIGTGAAIASVVGSRLAILLAPYLPTPRKIGETRWAKTIVGIRTSTSLSERARRILERCGAMGVLVESS